MSGQPDLCAEQAQQSEAMQRAQAHANLHGVDYVVWAAPWGHSMFSARDGDEQREGFIARFTPNPQEPNRG